MPSCQPSDSCCTSPWRCAPFRRYSTYTAATLAGIFTNSVFGLIISFVYLLLGATFGPQQLPLVLPPLRSNSTTR